MTTTRVPCSNAANAGERKAWTQSEFCTWQNSVTGQEPPKICIVYQPRRRPNIVQSLVGFHLQGCPKLTKLSQLLAGRSSPYCEDMWGDIAVSQLFFLIVDTCLSCEDTARQLCDGVQMANFWRFFCVLYLQRAACSTFQTCILNSH